MYKLIYNLHQKLRTNEPIEIRDEWKAFKKKGMKDWINNPKEGKALPKLLQHDIIKNNTWMELEHYMQNDDNMKLHTPTKNPEGETIKRAWKLLWRQ